MMKRIIVIFSLLIFCLNGNAQTRYGFKGGLNISDVDINLPNYSSETNIAFHLGVLADFPLNRSFHLQPELQFSREGNKAGSIDYFNIPLLLQFYYLSGFHIHTGPQLGILVNAEGGKGGLEPINAAAVVGLGYENPVGITFDIRYARGFINIIEEDFQVPSGMGYNISGFQGLTWLFQASVGWKF